jgi:dTDP-glucose 4,6-dehydratase
MLRQPEITRAKIILGWEPKVRFEEGIVRTIDYFRQWLERASQR